MGKNQDFIFYGSNIHPEKGSYEWGVLLDGHGSYDFIFLISKLDWKKIMSCDDPWKILHEILLNNTSSYYLEGNGGSTLLMMRAFSNHIETISVGDSEIIIHNNGIQVYKSTPHNLKSESEQNRIKQFPDTYCVTTNAHITPQIRSSTTLQARQSQYYHFDNYNLSIAMTQSIGHHNIMKYEPERHIEYFESHDTIQCILGSDGLFEMMIIEESILPLPELSQTEIEDIHKDTIDMLTMTAEELVLKAEQRWKQEWIYMWHPKKFNETIKTPYSGYDDISAIVWRKMGYEPIINYIATNTTDNNNETLSLLPQLLVTIESNDEL